ncbi:hypothetical protein M9H77_37155 [Catharanthus roseus]|uniref:Uncharacterized protein n=1 Tax=Catharanthus roseus TaxID=4058 RepID=A0ACB9ZUQ6_CATRO|nr:hypothetical protein M9H77_37155 [Catharanthus roseus]
MSNLMISSIPTHSSPKFLRVSDFIPKVYHRSSQFIVGTEFGFFPHLILIRHVKFRQKSFPCPNYSLRRKKMFSPRCYQNDGCRNDDYIDILRRWINVIRSVLPGGSWWNLYSSEELNFKFPTAAKPISVWHALRTMWLLVADEKWILYIAFGSLTIAALSDISMPSILASSIFSAESGKTDMFYRSSNLLVLLCLTTGIFSGLRSGCFAIANTILVKRLRETLYSVLLIQDISFFDSEAVADLSIRLGTDCQQLSNTIGNDIHLIIRNLLQGTGALVNLLLLSWPLALSSMVICSVLSAIFLVYGRYQKNAAMLSQELTSSANKVAKETLSLIRIVRAYGTEKEEVRRFMQWIDSLAFVGLRENVAYGYWNLSFNFLYRSTQVLAVLLGGTSILTGHVSAEQLTKYVFYCEWLIYAAWRLQDSMSSLLQSVGACEKVFQLMNLLPSNQFLTKGEKLSTLMGDIEFVNVSFQYPSRQTVQILENVSFSVQANEMIAVVGLSGSGKSTLINILLRLSEPTNGQILIDGYPIEDLDVRWLREQIGFVGQEPHLFHMDVKSNIRYGCSRDIRQEDIELAAKQAYAHDFIASLPNGYETIVSDDLLSKGQKQRIALARAIVRDPAILVLDEATSALDSESEYYIKCTLHSFKSDSRRKRTIIIVAHRMSTVRAADRILVMDNGRVVEVGTHTELVYKDGLYARLLRVQSNDLAL